MVNVYSLLYALLVAVTSHVSVCLRATTVLRSVADRHSNFLGCSKESTWWMETFPWQDVSEVSAVSWAVLWRPTVKPKNRTSGSSFFFPLDVDWCEADWKATKSTYFIMCAVIQGLVVSLSVCAALFFCHNWISADCFLPNSVWFNFSLVSKDYLLDTMWTWLLPHG